ncbi:MAG: hypothetical protein AAFY48_18005 [Bacteroidota bacterium]
MANYTNPTSPKLLKGAFVELSNGLIGPIPNVIIFQYNPTSMSRTLTTYAPPTEGDDSAAATAQVGDPPEELSLTLQLDAADALETPSSHPIAQVFGVADRLAALEQLLYPNESLIGGLIADAASTLTGGAADLGGALFRESVPLVLFVYGPGKIYPVRIKSYSVEEQAFSPALYPIRAKVSMSMKILTPDEVDESTPDKVIAAGIAKTAYRFYRTQQQGLAVANVANTVESILGMLPF